MSKFSPEFLAAVVDTLLPGLPTTVTHAALPAATQIGVDQHLVAHLTAHPQRVQLIQRLQSLADLVGGEQNFVTAHTTTRTAMIQRLETLDAPAFYAFLLIITADYYQTDEVIQAMGWPAAPPQPHGYPLPPFDEALLAPVKTRAPLWRSGPLAEAKKGRG